MTSLSWNWPAKQQGITPPTRSKTVARQDVQRQDIAKIVDHLALALETNIALWM